VSHHLVAIVIPSPHAFWVDNIQLEVVAEPAGLLTMAAVAAGYWFSRRRKCWR
jgi:hypothetical protein